MSDTLSPFDFVKEIQVTKRDLMVDSVAEKAYAPFVVNRALSYELDSLMAANAMNQRHHADKKYQFHFLLRIIRSQKRGFHKWPKPIKNEDLEAIKTLFACSHRKALEALRILTPEQIASIREITTEGGVTRKHK